MYFYGCFIPTAGMKLYPCVIKGAHIEWGSNSNPAECVIDVEVPQLNDVRIVSAHELYASVEDFVNKKDITKTDYIREVPLLPEIKNVIGDNLTIEIYDTLGADGGNAASIKGWVVTQQHVESAKLRSITIKYFFNDDGVLCCDINDYRQRTKDCIRTNEEANRLYRIKIVEESLGKEATLNLLNRNVFS